MKPENKANFTRVIRAAGYSMKGLKSAYINEAAFGSAMVLSRKFYFLVAFLLS